MPRYVINQEEILGVSCTIPGIFEENKVYLTDGFHTLFDGHNVKIETQRGTISFDPGTEEEFSLLAEDQKSFTKNRTELVKIIVVVDNDDDDLKCKIRLSSIATPE